MWSNYYEVRDLQLEQKIKITISWERLHAVTHPKKGSGAKMLTLIFIEIETSLSVFIYYFPP